MACIRGRRWKAAIVGGIAVSAIGFSGLIAPRASAIVVDPVTASCSGTPQPSFATVDDGQFLLQPFTAAIGGAPAAVDLRVLRQSDGGVPLEVRIRAFDPATGQPGPTLAHTDLAHDSVPPDAPGGPAPTTVSFGPATRLAVGGHYAVELSTTGAGNSGFGSKFVVTAGSCQPGRVSKGQGLPFNAAGFSLPFEARVTVMPKPPAEPETAPLRRSRQG